MTLRILMVEDSAAMRAHLTDKLASGAEVAVVGVAATEAHAKYWMECNPDAWDIALVDLFLREGSGAGVVEYCRQLYPDRGVLVMTNHAMNERLRHDCMRMGADAVYHKAGELDDLVAYCAERAIQRLASVQ